MEALIPFIVAIVCWIVIYKYNFNKRNKSKLLSHIMGFAFSFLAFVITVIVIAPPLTEEQKLNIEKEKKQKELNKIEEQKIEKQKKAEEQKLLELKKLKDEPKQIQKEEIKGLPDTITTKLTLDVINSLKNNYGIEAGIFEDMPLYYDKLCSTDKACQIYAGKIQIQVIYKSVIVNSSSRVSPKDYLETCSASFIALTNVNKDLAESIITQAFDYASKNGSAKSETLGVEFKVVPDQITGLLKCQFFKP